MGKVKLAIVVVLVIAVALLLVCFFAVPGVFVNDDEVVDAVQKQGYSDVKISSSHVLFVSWRGCSNSDHAAYKMQATNAKSQKIELIACVGWPFKGVTVRTK